MSDSDQFYLVGGRVCLDFINTVVVEHGASKDLIAGLESMVAWGVAVQLIERANAARLAAVWRDAPDTAEAIAAVQEFRRALRGMVVGLAGGEAAEPAAIAAINAELRSQRGFSEVYQTASGFEKRSRPNVQRPEDLLGPIAESAADLLCYGDPSYLKKCEGTDCVLYFYDTTKNHSRRWCSMTGCGNRAKAAAFYQRQRARARADHQADRG